MLQYVTKGPPVSWLQAGCSQSFMTCLLPTCPQPAKPYHVRAKTVAGTEDVNGSQASRPNNTRNTWARASGNNDPTHNMMSQCFRTSADTMLLEPSSQVPQCEVLPGSERTMSSQLDCSSCRRSTGILKLQRSPASVNPEVGSPKQVPLQDHEALRLHRTQSSPTCSTGSPTPTKS